MSTTKQQQDILEAARSLLASGGPQALRVRDIADAAGCTTMTVYSRFGGKDGIVEAIYVDGFIHFAQALRDARGDSPIERSYQQGVAYRTWARANPGAYQVMFTGVVPGFSPSQQAQAVADKAFQVLVESVVDLQDTGVVRAGDPIEIAWALWGITHGLVMLELAGMSSALGDIDFAAVYSAATTAMMQGHAPG